MNSVEERSGKSEVGNRKIEVRQRAKPGRRQELRWRKPCRSFAQVEKSQSLLKISPSHCLLGCAKTTEDNSRFQTSYSALFWIILLPLGSLFAQPTPTSTEVLRTALTDDLYILQLQDTAFFTDAPLRLPRLEEMEFRTETHEFEPQLQEYALRLKFNSRRQVRVQERINNKEQELQYHTRQEYLEEVLFARYQLLVDIWYQQEKLAIAAARAPWYRDQEGLIRQRIGERGERSYDDLLKLEDDRLAYRQEQLMTNQRLQQVRQLTGEWTGQPTDTVLLTAWPSTEDIAAYWQSWQTDTLILPWAVNQQRVQKELVALELAAEQAEERNRLNFLQVRYQGNDRNPVLNEQLTLGAGITIPFRSARSVKNQYLELERQTEARQETERTNRWLGNLQEAETQLAAQLERCFQLQTEYDRYAQQFAPQQLAAAGVTSPELLLRAQGGLFHRQQLLLEEQYQLYQDYLEVLLLSGRLTQVPYRNWLTTTRETLR